VLFFNYYLYLVFTLCFFDFVYVCSYLFSVSLSVLFVFVHCMLTVVYSNCLCQQQMSSKSILRVLSLFDDDDDDDYFVVA